MKEACTLGANGWAVSDRSAHENFGMTRGRQGSPQAAERAIIILKSDRERATESVTACHCRCTPDIMVLSQAVRYQQTASYRRKSRYTELSDIRQSRVLCFRGARDSSALCEKFDEIEMQHHTLQSISRTKKPMDKRWTRGETSTGAIGTESSRS